MSNHLSRRRFLTTGAGLGAALLVPGPGRVSAQGTGAASPHLHGWPGASVSSGGAAAPGSSGALLVEPEVRRAVGGELRTTLRVQYAYRTTMCSA
jgi:hypothetical protein